MAVINSAVSCRISLISPDNGEDLPSIKMFTFWRCWLLSDTHLGKRELVSHLHYFPYFIFYQSYFIYKSYLITQEDDSNIRIESEKRILYFQKVWNEREPLDYYNLRPNTIFHLKQILIVNWYFLNSSFTLI